MFSDFNENGEFDVFDILIFDEIINKDNSEQVTKILKMMMNNKNHYECGRLLWIKSQELYIY